MDTKPIFALIIRTPPPPDYFHGFSSSTYADRIIVGFIPKWRNKVNWKLVINDLPKSKKELKKLMKEHVKIEGKSIPFNFKKTKTTEFKDTHGHKGILVQAFQ